MINNPVVKNTAQLLNKSCELIKKMYLTSFKVNNDSELTSFKLVLILDDKADNLPELECRLYLEVDCEIPYDLIFYRESEFERLRNEIGTFAWKTFNSGAEIHG